MGITWDSSFLCSIEYPLLNYFVGFINMQPTKCGLFLLFGYGNEGGGASLQKPEFGMEKQRLVMVVCVSY